MNKALSLTAAARCYSNTFLGEPWNKAFIDPNTGNFVGMDHLDGFAKGILTLAYPLRPTAKYIEGEVSKPGSQSVIQSNPDNPNQAIAFGWGYLEPTTTALIADKWPNLSPGQAHELESAFILEGINQQLWYLSEVGILPSFQKQGLGTDIVKKLICNLQTDTNCATYKCRFSYDSHSPESKFLAYHRA